ncbi:hypothetical protein BT63DRAFT_474110 [Microthyrium microscopicum]|uniref:BTB domain-containing protein n=1 Tax=Microthyrium microscopicum TaxID=703497 RepID=A0A6A6UTU3_9PEZI|nr:hypothetical protein BT63DRAFT_474110 [Microthyrium microscopicum]
MVIELTDPYCISTRRNSMFNDHPDRFMPLSTPKPRNLVQKSSVDRILRKFQFPVGRGSSTIRSSDTTSTSAYSPKTSRSLKQIFRMPKPGERPHGSIRRWISRVLSSHKWPDTISTTPWDIDIPNQQSSSPACAPVILNLHVPSGSLESLHRLAKVDPMKERPAQGPAIYELPGSTSFGADEPSISNDDEIADTTSDIETDTGSHDVHRGQTFLDHRTRPSTPPPGYMDIRIGRPGNLTFRVARDVIERSPYFDDFFNRDGGWDDSSEISDFSTSYYFPGNESVFPYILEYLKSGEMPCCWDDENTFDFLRANMIWQEAERHRLPGLISYFGDGHCHAKPVRLKLFQTNYHDSYVLTPDCEIEQLKEGMGSVWRLRKAGTEQEKKGLRRLLSRKRLWVYELEEVVFAESLGLT